MNTDLVNEIRNAYKTQMNDKVLQPIPVVEVGTKLTKTALCMDIDLVNNTTATFLASTNTQDIYITSAQIGFIKDATSTATYIGIAVTINGATRYILKSACITLTAQTGQLSISFPHPIKIDRLTAVQLRSGTNAANISVSGSISYYIDEYSNA